MEILTFQAGYNLAVDQLINLEVELIKSEFSSEVKDESNLREKIGNLKRWIKSVGEMK